jgi:hypothetical protein
MKLSKLKLNPENPQIFSDLEALSRPAFPFPPSVQVSDWLIVCK